MPAGPEVPRARIIGAMRAPLLLALLTSSGGACSSSDSTSTPTNGPAEVSDARGEVDGDVLTAVDVPSTGCSGETPYETPLGCVECRSDQDCDEGGACVAGSCTVCEPGARTCNANSPSVCKADGSGWETMPDCGALRCEGGQCVCTPGEQTCSDDGSSPLTCTTGAAYAPAGVTCEFGCYSGQCLLCRPDTGRCDGKLAYYCADATLGEEVKTCSGQCLLGKCLGGCGGPKLSNTGCNYFAVDLDNADDNFGAADDAQFAIVVSNVGSQSVDVKVTDTPSPSSDIWAEATIPPGEVRVLELTPYSISDSMIAERAWHLEATGPVVAYQFNPIDNASKAASTDASLLIPVEAWGTEYYVMTRAQVDVTANLSYRGTLTVVAAENNTEVTVTVGGKTAPGTGLPPKPLALQSGQSLTVTLQAYEVLNLESGGAGVDLTGSHVVASKPVGVFAGHESATPSGDCCTDHLEEQLIPVETLGSAYVAARTVPRGAAVDYWRVVAVKDGTTFTTEPAQTPIPTLDAGEWFELTSTADFVIEGNNPFLLGQFLDSGNAIAGVCGDGPPYGCVEGASCKAIPSTDVKMCTFDMDCAVESCPEWTLCKTTSGKKRCEAVGDASFIIGVPTSQFLNEYLFLVPTSYNWDFLTVVAPASAVIRLDAGEPLVLSPVGDGEWATAVVEVGDGPHRIASDDGAAFGITAYGLDDDVSYGYPGGLGAEKNSP